MTKILIAVLSALGLFGAGSWVGSHFTAQHYQILLDKGEHSSDVALQTAQTALIAAQRDRDAALDRERKAHEDKVAADERARSALDDRMRSLAAALRINAISCPVANPGGRRGAGAGDGGSGAIPPRGGTVDAGVKEFDAAFREFNTATDVLVGAAQHCARELTGILAVAPK